MNHIWSVFRKDGLELLRDRRTLFVNVVLPVLIYPVMLIFLLQVYQLTQANLPPPPRVALVDLDAELTQRLDPTRTVVDEAPDAETAAAKPSPPKLVGVDLDADHIRALVPLLVTLDAAEQAARATKRPGPELVAASTAARAAVLEHLRAADVAAVVAGLPSVDGQRRLIIAADDADAQYDRLNQAVDEAIAAWKTHLIQERLAEAGLPASTIEPVQTRTVGLAPTAQAARMRLAGIIPLLLVIMAVSGAFHPALDLIAGERERGTLETLLTWPVSRRDIFLGKLLVTILAGMIAVVLNLCSLGLTFGLAGAQLAAAGGGGGGAGFLAAGIGTLVLSFVALLPLIVTLSAISLAVAGFAASSKEAQNYLSPLFLVVTLAAGVAMVPDARPTLALDLVPITGPVLALKEALRASEIPWLHLLLSTATSIAVAAVVVSWSVRLLDKESFRYPGLVRAGWGRWRRWGIGDALPGGLEALGLFAACAAAFLLLGPALERFGVVAQVAGPLLVCLGLPVLLYAWAGAYRPQHLYLGAPRSDGMLRGLLAIPLAIAASIALGSLQPQPPMGDEQTQQIGDIMQRLADLGGPALLVLVLAVAPGICEELLCRGPLLVGLRRGIGSTGAILVSSFCFAALHLTPYRFIPQFTLGVFLALLALRCASVWPGVLVHIGHNGLIVLMPLLIGDDVDIVLEPGLALPVAVCALAGLAVLAWPRKPGTDPTMG